MDSFEENSEVEEHIKKTHPISDYINSRKWVLLKFFIKSPSKGPLILQVFTPAHPILTNCEVAISNYWFLYSRTMPTHRFNCLSLQENAYFSPPTLKLGPWLHTQHFDIGGELSLCTMIEIGDGSRWDPSPISEK